MEVIKKMCIKCSNPGNSPEWTFDEIGKINWNRDDFNCFKKGPVCESCIRDYFVKYFEK